MGEERLNRFLGAFDEEAPTSIRINPRKISQKNRPSVAPVPWCEEGCYLEDRPQFTFDPLFHAGCYYVQEAASMFVTHAVRSLLPSCFPNGPIEALDMCAAPGGKSTALRTVLPEGSQLVSNEPIPTRAQILLENITKWGWPDCIVTNSYPRDYRRAKLLFDVILCDVPCSGEGMFRKDAATIGEWSPQNVEKCWRLQREIVSDAWPCLCDGGLFIYSTCTFNTKENEENIRWICDEFDAEVLPVEVPEEWGITGCLTKDEIPVYRFLPHRTKGEGFFMAVLRKAEADYRPFSPRPSKKKEKQKGAVLPKEALRQAASWIDGAAHEVLAEGDMLYAFPQAYVALLTALRGSLRILKAGVKVAEVKGRDLIPAHDLVLSTIYHKEAFPQVELTEEQAIAYLRREVLSLPEAPRGYVVVTKKHVPLGLVKNLGSRANNLYPAEWRIRSSYLKSFKSSSMSQNSSE